MNIRAISFPQFGFQASSRTATAPQPTSLRMEPSVDLVKFSGLPGDEPPESRRAAALAFLDAFPFDQYKDYLNQAAQEEGLTDEENPLDEVLSPENIRLIKENLLAYFTGTNDFFTDELNEHASALKSEDPQKREEVFRMMNAILPYILPDPDVEA